MDKPRLVDGEKPITGTPFYPMYYQAMVRTCREHGYALAVHGSLGRDLDLVAVPWVENVSTAEELVRALKDNHGLMEGNNANPEKPHGRKSFVFVPFGDAEHCYIDLSVVSLAIGEERELREAVSKLLPLVDRHGSAELGPVGWLRAMMDEYRKYTQETGHEDPDAALECYHEVETLYFKLKEFDAALSTKPPANADQRDTPDFEKIAKHLFDQIEHGIPEAPDHSCGPYGNCDGLCVDFATFSTHMDRIRKQLYGADAKDGGDK